MKILHIVNSLECGGLEKVVIDLAGALTKNGIEADIMCLGCEGELALQARARGLCVASLGKKDGFSPLTVFKLAGKIRSGKYDLVHTHNFAPLIYGSMAAWMAEVKCVNTRHGSDTQSVNAILWALNSKIIAVGNYARDELLRNNKINLDKMAVIYNAVEGGGHDAVSNDERKKLKSAFGVGDKKTIGIAGRLVSVKDHGTLLKAFKIVSARHPGVCLLVAGDGPLKAELKQYVTAQGLESRVRFLGFRPDIRQFLEILDVFVLSSLKEGISLAILEAMAASRPVVATMVGGNPEIVEDGKTGFLVPSQSPEQMAEKISQLLMDPLLAKAMGEAGRVRVKENFSLDHMLKGYMGIYEEVLGRKGTVKIYGQVDKNISYHESFS